MTATRKIRNPASSPAPGTRQKRSRTRVRHQGAGVAMLVGLVVLAVFLAARAGGTGGSGTPQPGQGSPQGTQNGSVAFAQCVRSHGVPNFPDPQNGHFLINSNVQNSPNLQSAVQVCHHLLPNGGTNGGGSNNSQLLAFAHCMQTHGVPQFPDPTANGGIGLPQGVDPNSPQFQQSWHACQSKLPGSLQGQQP